MTSRAAKRQRTDGDLLTLEVIAQRDQVFPGDLVDMQVQVKGAQHHLVTVANAPYTVHLEVAPTTPDEGGEHPLMDCTQEDASGDAGDAPAVFVPRGEARLVQGSTDFAVKVIPSALKSSLKGAARINVVVRVHRADGVVVEGRSKVFDAGGGLPVDKPLQLCHQKLVLDNDRVPERWFKDEGGQANCISLHGRLIDAFGNPVREKDVRIQYNLFYDDHTQVKSQQTLLVSGEPSSNVTNRDGEVRQSARIKEVSMRHQNKKFVIKVSTGRSGVCPAYTKPIEVRSKRKPNKRRQDAANEEKRALMESVSSAPNAIFPGAPAMPPLGADAAGAGAGVGAAGAAGAGIGALSGSLEAPLRRICSWVAHAKQTLDASQWMHVGYEQHDNGTLKVSNPIFRCPCCGAFRSDVAGGEHKPGCKIARDLQDFDTVKPIFEALVQRLGFDNAEQTRIQTLLVPGHPSASAAAAAAARPRYAVPAAVPPAGYAARAPPRAAGAANGANGANGAAKDANLEASQGLMQLGGQAPPPPLRRQTTRDLVRIAGATPIAIGDDSGGADEGYPPLPALSRSESGESAAFLQDLGGASPPARSLSGGLGGLYSLGSPAPSREASSDLGGFGGGGLGPVPMARGISDALQQGFSVSVPEEVHAVLRIGEDGGAAQLQNTLHAFDRDGILMGKVDDRMDGTIELTPLNRLGYTHAVLDEIQRRARQEGARGASLSRRPGESVGDFVQKHFALLNRSVPISGVRSAFRDGRSAMEQA